MFSVTFAVKGIPPYKQAPADEREKHRQLSRVEELKACARKSCGGLVAGPCSVTIRYDRCKGRADSGNIVNGVLDALEGVVYENDNQVVTIHYVEGPGEVDWYQVIVTELQTTTPTE